MPRIFYALVVFVLSVGVAYSANDYPVNGAWALVLPTSPQLQADACKAFGRLGLSKISGDAIGGGELIVFNGSKRHNFGGYADDVTPNISIRRLSDKQFDVIDRWVSDGEGGIAPGPKRRRYTLTIVDPHTIEIKQGRSRERYAKCD